MYPSFLPSVRFSQFFGLSLVQTVSISSQLSYCPDDISTVHTPVLYSKVGSIKHSIHSTNFTQTRFVLYIGRILYMGQYKMYTIKYRVDGHAGNDTGWRGEYRISRPN